MSHIISKITFKVFMLILGVMIILTAYFSIVSYMDTISAYEQAEMKKLRSVGRTYSHHLESFVFRNQTNKFNKKNEGFRKDLANSVFAANRLNDLDKGIYLVLIDNENGVKELVSAGKIQSSTSLSPNASTVLGEMPSSEVTLGLEKTELKNHLFYAYPLEFPLDSDYRGYLFVEENIGPAMAEARSILMRRLGLAMLFIMVLGWIGQRFLKRILKHEVLSKQKLKDFAEIVDNRNAELEKLSFVLSKSENLILMTDKNGRIEWLNERGTGKNNYSAEELSAFTGKELAEISHYPKIKEVIEQVIRTKDKVIYQAKSYNEEKQEFWASTTATPIMNDSGDVENILFVDADITKLKQAELEISKLANFTQENTNAVMRFSKSGLAMYANEPGKRLLESWNTKVNETVSKPSILNTIRLVKELEQEQKLNLECDNRIFSLRFYPVKDKDYINVYAEDITEVKLAEQQYRERASLIEKHNLNITDSINYAKRIQQAIIPGEDQVRKFFNDSFLLFNPKDIVSGDFIWMHEIKPGKEYLVALADCTGHGVPGAMMSIIGHSLLNEIVEGCENLDPAEILTELNKEVIRTLRQKNGGETSDGMDVSIARIDIPNLTITFAGAYQEMYWMNGKLNIFKGDRMPIGGIHHDLQRSFSNHSFKVSKGDSIFMVSDGFTDQFGGPENKKFRRSRLVRLFEENHRYSMQAQSFIYREKFDEWKGKYEQVDDVSMIGIKF